jgi:RNA polymerase sigma factor (sigma-70 family)
MVKQLHRVRGELEDKLGRGPTTLEIAEAMEEPFDKIRGLLAHLAEPLSLSTPIREDSDGELGDMVGDETALSPEDAAVQSALVEEVERVLAPLQDRERLILRLRYGLDGGDPKTLDDIGAQFSLTRERIRQIEAKAIAKLRHPSAPAYSFSS